jgi:gentisate 1,2-dioxygenase
MNLNDPKASDLPPRYASELKELCLQPAWTQLRELTPLGQPIRHAKPAMWRYADVRAKLLEAGRIVPIELAERRVLGLANPGMSRLATTPSIFAGMQLILPGEKAPLHRHTPAAARLIVEGEGGFTVVNGMSLPMSAGDLILTPPHHWHEHRHEGSGPMIWLDLLDHPVGIPIETSYLVEDRTGKGASEKPDPSETAYRMAGLVPYRRPDVPAGRYPLMRYSWRKAREALEVTARYSDRNEQVHLMYINPESGDSALRTICFSARLLRPGEEIAIPRNSSSAVFHVIEGEGDAEIDGSPFSWTTHDTLASPTFGEVKLRNKSGSRQAFLIQADDGPLQHKLDFYEGAP